MLSGPRVNGWVPEWSIGHAWKACVLQKGTEGSNPSPSAGASPGTGVARHRPSQLTPTPVCRTGMRASDPRKSLEILIINHLQKHRTTAFFSAPKSF